MRKAVVAGQFYPEDKTALLEEVKGFIGKRKENKEIKGVIVPHAGYTYSGKCAGEVYRLLDLTGKSVILLGVNHQGRGEDIAVSLDDFETPLGIVKNDKILSEKIIEISETAKKDEPTHLYEHSLEVQLPFLQFLNKDVKIVPIVLKNYNYQICKKLAFDIYQAIKELKLEKEIIIVASSDFTHFGAGYGFMPFSDNVKENLYNLDKGAIKLIEEMDAEKFLNYASKTTICGSGGIATCIELCKLLGAKKGKLVDYYTSGDITRDYDVAVGYAGLVLI